ncbi:MAG: hypothetical protein DME22_16640 [Verrucomicrobia bacterium]|nr:MAG: hypothetical protein DME22_16640 [Verrucomicrobiota bacterium]
MNEERYHELLGHLLDDELNSTQARELADWLPRNPDLRSDVQHHLQLWDLFSQQCQGERTADAFVEACKTRIAAGADGNIFVRETEQKLREAAGKKARTEGKSTLLLMDWFRRFVRSPRRVTGLAAALLIGLSILLFPSSNNEPTLAVAKGTRVTLERDGQSFPAQDGVKLVPGDALKTSTNGATLITYGRENTRIVVASDTELKFQNWKEGKRFDLRQGRIEATVAYQPKLHPMVWRTAQAQATVVGTELALEVSTNTTKLEVLDGKVELSSRVNGQVIQLTNSEYAVVADGTELKVQRFPWGRGTILREYWLGIQGFHVGDLTQDARYPNEPSGSEYRYRFASLTNWGSNYGARFRGYLHPPRTGAYTFWIAASESAQLWLSSDERPGVAEMVASLSQPVRLEEWEKYPWQKSERIKLQGGRKYYIEALHKAEQPGADHCSVAWQRPEGKREVIAGEFLSPFTPATEKGIR